MLALRRGVVQRRRLGRFVLHRSRAYKSGRTAAASVATTNRPIASNSNRGAETREKAYKSYLDVIAKYDSYYAKDATKIVKVLEADGKTVADLQNDPSILNKMRELQALHGTYPERQDDYNKSARAHGEAAENSQKLWKENLQRLQDASNARDAAHAAQDRAAKAGNELKQMQGAFPQFAELLD